MQFHTGPQESMPPAPAPDDGVAQTLELSRSAVLVRSSFAPGAVPHSESDPLLTGWQTRAAEEELDRWSLFDECYREHMARRALEELFAAGEMSAFGY